MRSRRAIIKLTFLVARSVMRCNLLLNFLFQVPDVSSSLYCSCSLKLVEVFKLIENFHEVTRLDIEELGHYIAELVTISR